MTEREILVRAREQIARGWCQWGPQSGHRVCVLNALISATAGSIAAPIPIPRLQRLANADGIVRWQDAPERTQQDVLDLLDAALAEVDFEAESGFDHYVLKTATLEPRINPCSLVLRALPDGGYLNRIGVRNPGLAAVLADLPYVPGERVVSILGFDRLEWGDLAILASGAEVPALELNLSCPNTEAEPVGTDVEATQRAVGQARRYYRGELGAKLPPTATADVAKACEAEGADYLCLCNTLGTPLGGLSGRPLRALALDCIARIAPHVSLPIVGGGGIPCGGWLAAQPYIEAGATDVFMGTGNIQAGHTPEAAAEVAP